MDGAVKKNRKKKRMIIRVIVICLIVLAIIGIKKYFKNSFEPVCIGSIEKIEVNIPKGSSTHNIATILKDNNLIRSKIVFNYKIKKKKLDGKLRAGYYSLSDGMSLDEIIEVLLKGSKNKNIITFTIPEGFELKQIRERLSKLGLIDKAKFMELVSNADNFKGDYDFLKSLKENESLEGYLFPATYDVLKNVSEREIVCKMLDKFNEVYEDKIKNKLKNQELSLNELVTLASIIEREAKVDEERPIISAVFCNRMKKDMFLGSCATVQYALGNRKKKLSNNDLKIDSKYNTYINKGLPPGPIASPGLKSLEAALEPSDVNYLYFVTKKDGTGTHVFNYNYENHIKAKNESENRIKN